MLITNICTAVGAFVIANKIGEISVKALQSGKKVVKKKLRERRLNKK